MDEEHVPPPLRCALGRAARRAVPTAGGEGARPYPWWCALGPGQRVIARWPTCEKTGTTHVLPRWGHRRRGQRRRRQRRRRGWAGGPGTLPPTDRSVQTWFKYLVFYLEEVTRRLCVCPGVVLGHQPDYKERPAAAVGPQESNKREERCVRRHGQQTGAGEMRSKVAQNIHQTAYVRTTHNN